jgi:hypothetical protein
LLGDKTRSELGPEILLKESCPNVKGIVLLNVSLLNVLLEKNSLLFYL